MQPWDSFYGVTFHNNDCNCCFDVVLVYFLSRIVGVRREDNDLQRHSLYKGTTKAMMKYRVLYIMKRIGNAVQGTVK